MPAATIRTFAYQAMDGTGAIRTGRLDADSADAAGHALAGQSLIPLRIDEQGTGLNREFTLPSPRNRTTVKDLSVLTRQFASMTSSGMTILRSLSILEEQTTKPKLRAALGAVRSDVQSGSTLSTAMAEHPGQFPRLMTDMVRAGETGGFLDDALARTARMYEADAKLRAKIKSAMVYPVIVLIFSLLLATGVVVFIVPVFERMFAQLGGQLPLPTRILVTLSHNMIWLGPLVVVALVVGFRAFRFASRTNADFRLRVDRLKLRLPIFGPLLQKLAIGRWSRNLGTLLAVGVPIFKALDVVGGTAGNAVVGNAMQDVMAAVREGKPLSGPLHDHDLFPDMVVQMLQVGEETGQITEMLDKVADFYDDEVESATESLTSAMEPLLVILLGLVIGSMVICLYLPMFTIYQHIQAN